MVLRSRRGRIAATLAASTAWLMLSAGCASGAAAQRRARKQLDTAGTVHVPAGEFRMGSTLDERAAALELAYAGRGRVIPEASAWLKNEYRQTKVEVAEYWLMAHPVTQAEYLDYVRATGAPEPFVDPQTWERQRLGHPYALVERALWVGGEPRPERMAHPVVLVTQPEAAAYCQWWGSGRHGVGKLPSEAQWEKAARGSDGRAYPWGPNYEPGRLNSADAGPGDTVEVGTFDDGVSPYGALDMAGNVFEWTRSVRPPEAKRGPHDVQHPPSFVVKGGAFSTYGHASRAAARHFRPAELRHAIVGFRCVLEMKPDTKAKPKPKSKAKPRPKPKRGRAGASE